jgi:hypothetical protein
VHRCPLMEWVDTIVSARSETNKVGRLDAHG